MRHWTAVIAMQLPIPDSVSMDSILFPNDQQTRRISMRTLNEIEMSAVSGGVDPVPVWVPEPMPSPNPEDVYWLLENWTISRFE